MRNQHSLARVFQLELTQCCPNARAARLSQIDMRPLASDAIADCTPLQAGPKYQIMQMASLAIEVQKEEKDREEVRITLARCVAHYDELDQQRYPTCTTTCTRCSMHEAIGIQKLMFGPASRFCLGEFGQGTLDRSSVRRPVAICLQRPKRDVVSGTCMTFCCRS